MESSSVLSQQLDYKKSAYIHPTYRLSKILPQSGQQTQTITTAGGQENVFELPVYAFNLAKSYLNFTIAPPVSAVASTLNFMFMDCMAPIRQIQLYTRSGIYIADVNEVGNFTKTTWKYEIKQKEYFNNNKGYNGFLTTKLLQPFNNQSEAVSTVSSLLKGYNQRPTGIGGAAAAQLGSRELTTAYLETQYLEVGTAATADPVLNVQLDLGMLKNTIFELDKDIYFGEIILLRIVWNPTIKIYYQGATLIDSITNAAAATGNCAITNLALFLAVEKNDEITNQLRSQILSGGLNILIPYVYTYKFNLGGGSQTVSIRLNRGNGRKLKKIYHSVFNTAESSRTAYDNDERPYIANIPKVTSFYTLLDNQRLQEFDLNLLNLDDYLYQKDKLKDTLFFSSDIYYYNWAWLEDWTGLTDKTIAPTDTSNLETGISLDLERKWDFYGTMVAANYNHYTFAITEKMLTITSQGITVI